MTLSPKAAGGSGSSDSAGASGSGVGSVRRRRGGLQRAQQHRQAHRNAGARAQAALDMHLAAVQLGEGAHQRQAKTRALGALVGPPACS
jgi:hypothetical protein